MNLARVLNILEILSVAGRPLTAAEIHSVTGVPKATCYRLIQTLLSEKLVEYGEEDGRYVIGERLIRIALLGKSDVDVRRVSAPLLRTAATNLNEPTFLARFRDGRVEIIHVETPEDTFETYGLETIGSSGFCFKLRTFIIDPQSCIGAKFQLHALYVT